MSRAIFFNTLDNEAVLTLLLPWLDADSLLHLDTAIVSYDGPLYQPSLSTLKANWLACLKGAVGVRCVNGLPCSSSWIQWFSLRGVGVSSIRILEAYAPQITDESFEGACLSSLELIDLSECSDLTDAAIIAVVTTSPLLSTIKLTNCEKITSKALISISKNCGKLKTIDLAGCSLITSKAIQKLVRGCPLLESIDVSSCSCVSEKTVKSIARYLPGLLHIKLSTLSGKNTNSVSDDGIILLVHRCPLLQTINIDNSDEIGDDSMVAIGQRCPQLRHISVACYAITHSGISALAEGCTLLESITLSDCSADITNESMMIIARNCPRLLYIYLNWFQLLDDCGIEALAHGCPLLQSLELSRCHGVGVEDRFGECVGMMPNLRKIMIESSDISDDQIPGIVNGCSLLHTINIFDCRNITSQSMISIAAHCPTLRELSLENMNCGTEASLVALAKGCRLLESISIDDENCSFDNVVFDLIGQNCNLLRKIRLNCDFNVTDDGFLTLLLGCPRLEYIHLTAQPASRSRSSSRKSSPVIDVSRPCRACLHLTEIVLERCSELTDLTLFNIRDSCTALVQLTITSCDSMSESCIDELEAALPHLF